MIPRLTILLLVWSTVIQGATPDDAILVEQLKRDAATLLAEKALPQSDEQRKTFVESILNDLSRRCPASLKATSSQVDALQAGRCPFTDEEIRQAYAQLKQLAGDKPMPIFVEFYMKRFESGNLSAIQKTVFFNVTSCIREGMQAQKGK